MAQASSPLIIDVSRQGPCAIVRISGSADMIQAETMRQKLEDVMAAGPAVVVLDLAGMDFICSRGLGAIVAAHLKSRDAGGKFCLAAPQPAVRDLLETAGLTRLLAVYGSVAQALDAG